MNSLHSESPPFRKPAIPKILRVRLGLGSGSGLGSVLGVGLGSGLGLGVGFLEWQAFRNGGLSEWRKFTALQVNKRTHPLSAWLPSRPNKRG